ncbi:MAG TPA: thiamine-phosphate kinase [Mycobacteriales bacterium]|nr:thiamine-phosphate kinase [Mycobacteriales bacterium]
MEKKDLTLADVGEFGLIARVTAGYAASEGVPLGPGDDAAVVAAPDGFVVATTDLLVDGRHFRLDWSSAYDVGRKAAAQNLADIAAMGARPTAILVGLAAPADLPVVVAESIAAGLAAECQALGCSVVGGDVVRSDALLLAVTALGSLEGRDPVRRSGAVVGDRVVVAGSLGGAAAGLAALTAADETAPPDLLSAHRCPSPPYAAGPMLAARGASAMIDVSDGFGADLGHLLRASGCGAEVNAGRLPRHAALSGPWALAQGEDVRTGWVISGGEDHALVATMPSGAVPAAIAALAAVGLGLSEVGEVVAGGGIRWTGLPPGVPEPGGFDHFRLAESR